MTLTDWLTDARERLKTKPAHIAAKRSGVAFTRGIFRRIEPDIIPPVWSRDWDVLLILDACRVDQMQAVQTEYDCLESIESVWSQASCSIDWITKTFNEYPEQAQDCAYVTANPFAHNETLDGPSADLDNDKLAYFNPLYKHEWTTVGGIATVPPEVVTEYAIKAWRKPSVRRGVWPTLAIRWLFMTPTAA